MIISGFRGGTKWPVAIIATVCPIAIVLAIVVHYFGAWIITTPMTIIIVRRSPSIFFSNIDQRHIFRGISRQYRHDYHYRHHISDINQKTKNSINGDPDILIFRAIILDKLPA